MTIDDFLVELCDILERDEEITADMLLDDIEEWDSLARISFISFMDSEFSIAVSSSDVKSYKKVSDLIALIP